MQVINAVATRAAGAQLFAVSTDGSLAYFEPTNDERELVWVSRDGDVVPVGTASRSFSQPRVSLDGNFVLSLIDNDVWSYDLRRDSFVPLHSTQRGSYSLAIHPDGRRVVFDEGYSAIVAKAITGGGDTELIWESDRQIRVGDVSPDGSSIVFSRLAATSGLDIWSVALDDQSSVPFVVEANEEAVPVFSPNGNFVAYDSDVSGRREVYLRDFPRGDRRVRISTNGGTDPLWSRDGEELFYRSGDRMMSVVSIALEPELSVGTPVELFEHPSPETGFERHYDYDDANRRFLMMRSVDAERPRQIHLVLNWLEELRRRMPRQ